MDRRGFALLHVTAGIIPGVHVFAVETTKQSVNRRL
jgi:hypothetical protein